MKDLSSRLLAQTRSIVDRSRANDGWSFSSRPMRDYCDYHTPHNQPAGTGGKYTIAPRPSKLWNLFSDGAGSADRFEAAARPKREGAVAGVTGIIAGLIVGLAIWYTVGTPADRDSGRTVSVPQLKKIFAHEEAQATSGSPGMPQADYLHASQLVGQADQDLRILSQRHTLSGKDQERCRTALQSLSALQQALLNHHFDTRQLDDAIEKINGVARNNAIEPQQRKTLRTDLRNLRALSDAWRTAS
jgi:hypothetical protein